MWMSLQPLPLKELNPLIYDEAAERLVAVGWRSLGQGGQGPVSTSTGDPRDSGHCITNAISVLADQGKYTSDDTIIHQASLAHHLGLTLNDLWKLNDSQPDYETGKEWAITTLRGMAESVREAITLQAEAVVSVQSI